MSKLVSISYIPDGHGYWWRAYLDGREIGAAWNSGRRRVAEQDAKSWLRSRGLA